MQLETFLLQPGGTMPNNQILPVLLYRQAIADEDGRAEAFEAQFAGNGWQDSWRNGVYDYHHYHTQAHEVLGIASGRARLIIGGPGALDIKVQGGDCLVLPAGTGHCRLSASPDFLVVGAYPPGQHADIKTDPATDRDLAAIRACALPDADPVDAGDGALKRFWHSRRMTGTTPSAGSVPNIGRDSS